MKLSKRLLAIAGLVAHPTVADIGCDHGLLPIYLIKTGKISRAVATDKNPGPLDRARTAVASAGLADYIELRLGPGLGVIRAGEAKTCVIAGMGGIMIMDILRDDLSTAACFKQLVLSPERDVPTVRRFLHMNGFSISDEKMVFENGIFYNILNVTPGKEEPCSDLEYAFGKPLLKKNDAVLKMYVQFELDRLGRIFYSFEKSGNSPDTELLTYHALCNEAAMLLSL